jgi:hypothetical protein
MRKVDTQRILSKLNLNIANFDVCLCNIITILKNVSNLTGPIPGLVDLQMAGQEGLYIFLQVGRWKTTKAR